MVGRIGTWTALALAAGLSAAVAEARAQGPGPRVGTSAADQSEQGLSSALYGGAAPTPLTPYLNPYLIGMSPGNQDYLTYMYLANQRAGGIGSGVISGTRPAPGVAAGTTRAAAPSPGPSPAARNAPYTSRPSVGQNRVTMPLVPPGPGSNSGGYFVRGPNATQGAARFFNRTTPARNNGR